MPQSMFETPTILLALFACFAVPPIRRIDWLVTSNCLLQGYSRRMFHPIRRIDWLVTSNCLLQGYSRSHSKSLKVAHINAHPPRHKIGEAAPPKWGSPYAF